jgi:AAA ATPase domain
VFWDKKRATCFGNTREALLKDISKWVPASDKPPIYVLSGLAGIGKTTVAQTVAERSHHLGSLGGSFFFSRGEVDRRNAGKFFTTIAYQLCIYDDQFAQAIGSVLRMQHGLDATTKDPAEQLEALILNPLRDIVKSRSGPIIIVVDALDECDDEDGPIILNALNRLVRELPLFRIVLTTRPQLHLQDLDGPETHKVFYLQNIEDKIVDGDIRLYLRHSLSQEQVQKCLRLRQPWSANDEEIDCLVRGAGRLFIIASTSVLFILDKKVRDPASRMEKLRTAFDQNRTPLNALNDFYTVILRSALPAGSDSDAVERFQTVIGTIVLMQDPLPISALAKLVGLRSDCIYAVLDNLQPVISLGDGGETPHIYHKSFPDYLTDATRCTDMDLCIVLNGHHTRIATRCFQVINKLLSHNIMDLGTPDRFLKNDEGLVASGITDAQLNERIPLELRYACIYWANHLGSAVIEDTTLMKDLELFGSEHLLHWIEALSWIRKFNVASRAVDVPLKLLVK